MNRIVRSLGLSVLALGLVVLAASPLFAWTSPTASAPNNNVSAPVNVGSTAQNKNGTLGVNALAVFGNSLLQASSYLNWGTTSGSTGYGIRDTAGVLEFKNSGGSWQTLQAIVYSYAGGATSWTVSGTHLYSANTGNVGIGATSPGQKLDVNGNARAAAFLYSSDARLKEDVAKLETGLSTVMALRPVSYRWKNGFEGVAGGTEDIGFIAQEVEKLMPEVVHTDTSGYKSVDYPKLVPVLVKALQEQQAEIEALKADVAALNNN